MTAIAIGHRGDPVGACENTLPAFASAVALGADWIEFDLRRTKDGAIVVLHDQSLERLWGRDVSVGELDLVEVAALGDDHRRIPTLREVLDAVHLPVMVDFTRREVVPGGLQAVREAGALGRVLFVSGNEAALRLLRRLCSDARLGLTDVSESTPPLRLLAELRAEFWNPTFGLVTPHGVATAHAAGRRVSTWTVDAEADMARVAAAGVDAVVSNRVAALVRFLHQDTRPGQHHASFGAKSPSITTGSSVGSEANGLGPLGHRHRPARFTP